MTVQPPRRFLTIDDYSDPMKAYADCLAQLRSLHGNFASDSASKDKRRALYLLSRAAIDSGCAAFELLERRHIPAIYQIGRHILEIRALVEYFIILEEDHEDIRRWFRGNIVEARYKKSTKRKIEAIIERKRIIPFKGLPKDDLLKREQMIQKSFSVLSDYCHPTIRSVEPRLQRCRFGQVILRPIMDCCVDVQRMYFDPEDSVSGLMFSEFELLFREKETTGGWEFSEAPHTVTDGIEGTGRISGLRNSR